MTGTSVWIGQGSFWKWSTKQKRLVSWTRCPLSFPVWYEDHWLSSHFVQLRYAGKNPSPDLTLSITWQEGVLVEEVLSLGVERAVDGDYIANLHQRLHRVMICQVQLFFDTFLRKAGRLARKKGSGIEFWVVANSVFVGKDCSNIAVDAVNLWDACTSTNVSTFLPMLITYIHHSLYHHCQLLPSGW